MRTKKAFAAIALGASLSLTGATAASAAPFQNAQAAGLIAAAVNVTDAVNIDTIRILTNEGEINIPVTISNNRVLTDFVINALNNNNIRVNDVVDVDVEDNILIVVVDVL